MMQFPEHDEGKKSTNPKVQKLDKLARLLKVEISIDGVKYGNVDEDVEKNNTMITTKDVVEKYTSTNTNTNTETIDADDEVNISMDDEKVEVHVDDENKVDTDTDVLPSTPKKTTTSKKRGRPKKTT